MGDKIGEFQSAEWGRVIARREFYGNKALAVVLEDEAGEPIVVLSTNLPPSPLLPEGCFYAKDWSENTFIALDALQSGLFLVREDFPAFRSGFILADVWQIKEQP